MTVRHLYRERQRKVQVRGQRCTTWEEFEREKRRRREIERNRLPQVKRAVEMLLSDKATN